MTTLKKTAAGTIAALALTIGIVATSSSAQAFPKKGFGWGPGIGLGIAAGALIGAAAYNNSYYGAPIETSGASGDAGRRTLAAVR